MKFRDLVSLLPKQLAADPNESIRALISALSNILRRADDAPSVVKFPDEAVNDPDPNTLDDYAESSSDWDFTLIGSSTAGTQTYDNTTMGRYTKVGRLVFLEGVIVITAKDAAMAGNVLIGNLPFTSGSQSLFGGFAVNYSGINLSAGYSQVGIQVNGANATTLRLREAGDNVSDQSVTVANLSATAAISFSGFYST